VRIALGQFLRTPHFQAINALGMHRFLFPPLAFTVLALGASICVADTSGPARDPQRWSRQATLTPGKPSAALVGSDPKWAATVNRHKASRVETGTLGKMPDRDARRSPREHALEGIASYYWQPQMTASGERFDKSALTAAHRTLPFNTRVKVTHPVSGRSVVVRINDRGPFKAGRVIDLSERAADVLAMKQKGLAHVKLEVLQ
jgi:rare lipoprotein A (peptidoglycan hydrolase)